MTVSLRNTSGEPLYLGHPTDGRRVDVDELIHVEGELAGEQPDDAYLIGEGSAARAYPKSQWTNVGGSAHAEPDVSAPPPDQQPEESEPAPAGDVDDETSDGDES